MSALTPKNFNHRNALKGNDLSKFQEILRKKCQQQMRERRYQLFNKGRSGLLPSANVQETLTEIVRNEFNKLTTKEKSEIATISTKPTNPIINNPLDLDEALKEENEIIAEQEQWIVQEYERLLHGEEQMFDTLENDVICPMCKKSFLEEITDFIICGFCGLMIKSEISLEKFKYSLEMYVNMHSDNCQNMPDFSLVLEGGDTCLCLSCIICSSFYLIKTVES